MKRKTYRKRMNKLLDDLVALNDDLSVLSHDLEQYEKFELEAEALWTISNLVQAVVHTVGWIQDPNL